MNASPINFVFTLLGGLLLAGLLGWLRRPRLVVLVPRLFSYSHLTDRGQLAEITIFNRGFKTEENVELSLAPSLQYNIVGSSSEDVLLVKTKLVIPRIGPGDEVTALLLVENGAFSEDSISNCLSKETKGRTVAKLEDVPPTGPQRIAFLAMVIAAPLLLYSIPYAFEFLMGLNTASGTTKNAAKDTVEIRDWTVPSFYETTSNLFADLKEDRIQISVGPVTKKRDIATVPIVLKNKTSSVLTYSFGMNTTGSEGRIPSYERRTPETLVPPGASSEKSINVVIPIKSSNQTDRMVFIDGRITSQTGNSLSVTRTLLVE